MLTFALALALSQEAADPIDRWADDFRRGLLDLLREELAAGAPFPAAGEDAILATVTQDLLRFHLYWLAGDAMEGRLAGHPGEQRATEYIAAHFARLGLEPVGDADAFSRPTYFQHFPIGRGEQRFTSRNVVGLWRGADTAGETVVIGAHHDHVGRHGQPDPGRIGDPAPGDDIWNGANDNASGVAAVLAAADALARSGLKPRRSILFITFGAEEWGGVGSRYYVEHPLVPLDRTVAMLNLDMAGKGSLDEPTRATGVGTSRGDVLRRAAAWAAERAELLAILDETYNTRSDQASFGAARIPILRWHEADTARTDYHRASDHADRIDYPYMERVVRAAALSLAKLAWTPERIEWNPDFVLPRRGAYTVATPFRRALGIAPEIPPGGEGVRVRAVTANTPAAAAGLAAGDVILRIGSAPVTTYESYLTAVEAAPARDEVEIEVQRGDARQVLKTRFPR